MADRIEELQKRLAKDPNSKIFAQLAEEFRRAGMLREAIATCRDGLAKHPTYFSARVALGRALLEAGNFEEARVELEKVLAQVPDNILAHKFLGETYHHLGKLEEALAKYETAQSLAPGDSEVGERILKLTEEIRIAKQPPPTFRPVQDDLAMEFSDATVIEPPSPPAGTVRDTEFAVESEMIFDANNPTPVEAEIVLESEEKPVTSVFERQAREMRHSEPISDDARKLQEQFEAGPLTSTYTRHVREIRDPGGKIKPPPAPRRSAPPPPPQQDRFIEPEPIEEPSAHLPLGVGPQRPIQDETIVAPAPPAQAPGVRGAGASPAQEQVFDFGDEPPAEPAELPQEDFEVGELTSFFLGRTPTPGADATTYIPPGIPATPSLAPPPDNPAPRQAPNSPEPIGRGGGAPRHEPNSPEPIGRGGGAPRHEPNVEAPAAPAFDVDHVPGTESFAFLGENAASMPVEASGEGENLTSRALADLYYSQGHYEQALALYQNLQMGRGEDLEVRRRIAEIHERLTPKAEPVAVSAAPVAAVPRAATVQEDAARAALRTLELWLGAVRKR